MMDAAHDEWLTEGVMARRVGAWLVDALVVSILFVVLKLVFLAFGLITLGLGLPLLGLLPLLPFVYYVGFIISGRGATPGQQAMGLVLRRDADLMPLSGLQALVWTVGLIVTMVAGAFWVLVALVTVRHRTLHDLAAGAVMTRSRAVQPRTGIWTMPPGGSGRPFA
jgi:uncharacterized RDD family membrane protein YckC